MAKRRNFTPEFKAEVVLEALRGESSQAELCRRHNLSEQQLSKWKQQVVENVATLFASNRRRGRTCCYLGYGRFLTLCFFLKVPINILSFESLNQEGAPTAITFYDTNSVHNWQA